MRTLSYRATASNIARSVFRKEPCADLLLHVRSHSPCAVPKLAKRWATLGTMTINQLSAQAPFTTKDGSTIRSILDRTNAPVEMQSLAEATVPAGTATQRHYHKVSEEFYFILEGHGLMEINGETQNVGPGDAILIPRTAWHQITAASNSTLRFLCCCAPPYAHEDTYFE